MVLLDIEIPFFYTIIEEPPNLPQAGELMSGNAKFRWFLLAPILLAISVVVNSPVVSWAGELEEEKRRVKKGKTEGRPI